MSTLGQITELWPLFVGVISLVIALAQAHYRIQVLEEKVKILFDFHNNRAVRDEK